MSSNSLLSLGLGVWPGAAGAPPAFCRASRASAVWPRFS